MLIVPDFIVKNIPRNTSDTLKCTNYEHTPPKLRTMSAASASTSRSDSENAQTEGEVLNFEPKKPSESMLVITEDFSEFDTELGSGFHQDNANEKPANLQTENNSQVLTVTHSVSELSLVTEDVNAQSPSETDNDCCSDNEWKDKEKHIFILSSAGKPIYSRHGSEDKLVTLFGVMQALVSFVGDDHDIIRSIHVKGVDFVFLVKGPIILICVSRTEESVSQLVNQLNYIYSQVLSVLTLDQLTRIYEQRRNYDLRRLLTGSERLIDHLIIMAETEPSMLLGAVRCLRMPSVTRDAISTTITSCCSKIKNLVFAILLVDGQLVALVRMKKLFLHSTDLHLILNLVSSSESLKTAESWTPICLPKFNSRGYLHAHVSYLAEDCQACLLLLTVDPDLFFKLSEAKQKIVEKMRRNSLLEAINKAAVQTETPACEIGLPELRHFLYKCKTTAMFYEPAPTAPYKSAKDDPNLLKQYRILHHRLHAPTKPLKFFFVQEQLETMLGHVTLGYELYLAFEPLVTKANVIESVNKVLKWIKKEENDLFITNPVVF